MAESTKEDEQGTLKEASHLGIMSDNPTVEELTEQIKLMAEETAELKLDFDTVIKVLLQNRKAIESITDWAYKTSDILIDTENCIKGFLKKYYEDKASYTGKKRINKYD